VVAEGVVKTFKTSSDGKEQIIALMRPGDSFDDVPLLDHEPAPLSAQALGPVKLYGLRRADMELLLKQHPELAHSMLRLRAKRIRELIAVVEDLSFRSVAGRVARILLENAGSPSQLGPRLTQRDMAAMAGTAREVVGRSLKYLEEEGLVRMEDHRLVITDKAKLERMVEPGS
jgi:CRP/FNR family transcriptional regulator